jgi:hypothetical protein
MVRLDSWPAPASYHNSMTPSFAVRVREMLSLYQASRPLTVIMFASEPMVNNAVLIVRYREDLP